MKIPKHIVKSLLLKSILLVAIFTLFFIASISYKQIRSLNESGKLVFDSHIINNELNQLKFYAKDAESAQRGFLLSKDSSFLKTYFIALDNAKQSFDKLKKLNADNFEQIKNLDTLMRLLDRRFYFLETVLKTNAHKVPTSDTLINKILVGQHLMILASLQVDKIVANELDVLTRREIEYKKDIILSPFSVLFIVFLSLIVFGVAYIKINADLKKLAKSNNQLLVNKEIFEHTEQIADISNWCWDNRITYSKNQYRLLGCEPDEFEPTIENFITYVHPDDRQIVMDWNQEALSGSVTSSIYFHVTRKDGALRYFKSIGKAITDNYGKTFVIGVNADVTEQYRKEKMIEEKIADLEKSNKELFAFNHIASHDLQEPLRKVHIFISRIREKDFEAFPENIKEYFSGIERAVARMQRFIEDLLLYSRTSNVEKIFELTDLNTVLENCKQELSQQIEEKKAIIKSTSGLPTITVIPFQIHELFNNIISNSLKYSKTDIAPVVSIDSNIVSAKDLPELLANQNSKYYKISISDNGIGFEQEYAENIFTLFYRLHNKTDYSGTGVGLAICKLIVDNHKGIIQAEGVPNVGTTIIFYLPA